MVMGVIGEGVIEMMMNMSDIARCDEIISSMLRCVMMMRLCV